MPAKLRSRCRLMSKCYTIRIMDRNACIMKNRLKISNVNPSITAQEEKLKLDVKDSVEVTATYTSSSLVVTTINTVAMMDMTHRMDAFVAPKLYKAHRFC